MNTFNSSRDGVHEIPEIIRDLYALVHRLREIYPGRNFTPDGHMVGDLGEAVAAYSYGIKLFPPSSEAVDGVAPGGAEVQIKATQGGVIGIRRNCEKLLVLKIHQDGSFEEIYNGNGARVWNLVKDKKLPSNGQYSVSLSKLKNLQAMIGEDERVQPIRSLCLCKNDGMGE